MLKKIKAFFSKTWMFFAGLGAALIAFFVIDRHTDYTDMFDKMDEELKEHDKTEAVDDYKIEVIRKELAKKPEVKQDMTDEEVVKWWQDMLK